MESTLQRIVRSVRDATPGALKTAWWLVKIMFLVSLIITLLKYLGVITWLSGLLTPFFSHFGLPGEAALAYVSGYFVNCYSAIAVITTLNLEPRAITILAVMVLCAHNIPMETAVQRKTGTPAIRMVFVRTFSSLFLGWLLNKILPADNAVYTAPEEIMGKMAFWPFMGDWLLDTLKIAIPMVFLVFLLTIIQRLLSEFGVIRYITKFLKPVMLFFGLPAKTAFLWIVANTLGLAYGAAVMIDEVKEGKISAGDVDLLNHHISVSHSNVEDLLLFTAIGGMLPWMLLSRWIMSLVLVWERRLERLIKKVGAK
ncbi:MAG: nucleoside recognition domain-containing protein [Bacteroidales bacterium]|nr:nucleoside recognition domain-containing protein [Bacteroidales bacterium]MDD3522088.1 nucleoside recognition domain-containing protein [Bacteroidales bacterium]MDD4030332.1 nucleoside recognition domain-containing protein [Bacteroidales bacterium]MDD4434809.1 nucleoside recognition domain-containing protein [Bacteroidales bacterium]MDD5733044.1 nucleoside recognition domain-containing protein [Bacteroidales bacterium]